ncbi:MAG: YqeG family HAD IIIA-type phosphatase [Eubacteriales bacterium]|nr:YqeG family HAD IIIA-type phosphatase [Eubacteriales bacterium]MDD4324158.1 YqeG family HAD IIIA-type phosphatase [Eubacteriales bacterium]MDD4541636.1 YqeG family HAD IIIA-type phosphatase [Eubacteriales bacterium]
MKKLREKVRDYFFPDKIVDSIKDIDFKALKNQGFRVILLDIDNTLVPHGMRSADETALNIKSTLENLGLSPIVCSNAKAERLVNFSGSLNIECISDAKKPAPHAINEFMAGNDISADEIIMIGDQLITDVLAARRAKIPVILSKPISKKEIFYVKLKRPLERLLIRIGGKNIFDALEEVRIDSL